MSINLVRQAESIGLIRNYFITSKCRNKKQFRIFQKLGNGDLAKGYIKFKDIESDLLNELYEYIELFGSAYLVAKFIVYENNYKFENKHFVYDKDMDKAYEVKKVYNKINKTLKSSKSHYNGLITLKRMIDLIKELDKI